MCTSADHNMKMLWTIVITASLVMAAHKTTENEIYSGCGFESVPGQPQALKFCNAFGRCIKSFCGPNQVFSKGDCGCVQMVYGPAPIIHVRPAPKLTDFRVGHVDPSFIPAVGAPSDTNVPGTGDTMAREESPHSLFVSTSKPRTTMPANIVWTFGGRIITPSSSLTTTTIATTPPLTTESNPLSISQRLVPDTTSTSTSATSTTPGVNQFGPTTSTITTTSSTTSSGTTATTFHPLESTTTTSGTTASLLHSTTTTAPTLTASTTQTPLVSTTPRTTTNTTTSKSATTVFTSPASTSTPQTTTTSTSTTTIPTSTPTTAAPTTTVSIAEATTTTTTTTSTTPIDIHEETTSSSSSNTIVFTTSTTTATSTTPVTTSEETTSTTIKTTPPATTQSLSSSSSSTTTTTAKITTTAVADVQYDFPCGAEVNITGMAARRRLTGQGAFGFVHIGNVGVVPNNGHAHFSGRSYLTIPFYSGNRFTSGLSIVMFIKEDTTVQVQQGLASNCDTDVTPSFSIVLDPRLGQVIFKAVVMTTNTPYPFEEQLQVAIPYTPGKNKTVEMQCDGHKLVGRVDDHTVGSHTPSAENSELSTRQSPLSIGKGCRNDRVDNFYGDMSNIAIYRCVRAYSGRR